MRVRAWLGCVGWGIRKERGVQSCATKAVERGSLATGCADASCRQSAGEGMQVALVSSRALTAWKHGCAGGCAQGAPPALRPLLRPLLCSVRCVREFTRRLWPPLLRSSHHSRSSTSPAPHCPPPTSSPPHTATLPPRTATLSTSAVVNAMMVVPCTLATMLAFSPAPPPALAATASSLNSWPGCSRPRSWEALPRGNWPVAARAGNGACGLRRARGAWGVG